MTGSGAFDLVVTIDTEADNAWDRPAENAFANTRNLHRLQELFESRGVVPTYLVTYEVASDPDSVRFLRAAAERGSAEIGAHLHPWTNPPFDVRLAEREWSCHPYPHEYPLEVFEAKMRALGEAIRGAFGIEPRTYRAGRWGFVAAHARVLRSLGYVADTSVTPGVSWERYPGAPGGAGGPSYLRAPRIPYRLDGESAVRPAREGLLEIPVSIEWSRALGPLEAVADRLPPYHPVARALRASGLLRPVWLRPYRRFSRLDLVALVDRLFARRRPVWNVMFHSSEATAKTSPYSRNPEELEAFYGKLTAILDRALAHGARPSTLRDAALRRLEAA